MPSVKELEAAHDVEAMKLAVKVSGKSVLGVVLDILSMEVKEYGVSINSETTSKQSHSHIMNYVASIEK